MSGIGSDDQLLARYVPAFRAGGLEVMSADQVPLYAGSSVGAVFFGETGTIATLIEDTRVLVWSTESGALLRAIGEPREHVVGAWGIWTTDGRLLVARFASKPRRPEPTSPRDIGDYVLDAYDASSGAHLQSWTFPPSDVGAQTSVWNADASGRYAVVYEGHRRAFIWDLEAHHAKMEVHRDAQIALGDGAVAISEGDSLEVRELGPPGRSARASSVGQPLAVGAGKRGLFVICAQPQATTQAQPPAHDLVLYDVGAGTVRWRAPRRAESRTELALGGTLVRELAKGGALREWDLETGALVRETSAVGEAAAHELRASADGRQIALTRGPAVRLFDTETGAEVFAAAQHLEELRVADAAALERRCAKLEQVTPDGARRIAIWVSWEPDRGYSGYDVTDVTVSDARSDAIVSKTTLRDVPVLGLGPWRADGRAVLARTHGRLVWLDVESLAIDDVLERSRGVFGRQLVASAPYVLPDRQTLLDREGYARLRIVDMQDGAARVFDWYAGAPIVVEDVSPNGALALVRTENGERLALLDTRSARALAVVELGGRAGDSVVRALFGAQGGDISVCTRAGVWLVLTFGQY